MTKKSAGRLARDAAEGRQKDQLANNHCWDDLNDIHESCVRLLSEHTHLAGYAQNKELINEVQDKETLSTNIRLLASDLQKLNGELGEIHAQHAGKTGGDQDPDVVFNTIEIYERYNLFMERHQAVVMPTVYHIIEQFTEAEKSLAAKHRAAQEQAVDVVTDVNFTEVKATQE